MRGELIMLSMGRISEAAHHDHALRLEQGRIHDTKATKHATAVARGS
jgi:hypothetical protein